MTVVCLLDGCALRLCHRPGRVSAVLSASPLRSPTCRLSWRPGRGRMFWFCRAGSYANVSAFSMSTRHGSADLRYHASRLRSVLDSAWKAASGTRLKAEETLSPPAVQCYFSIIEIDKRGPIMLFYTVLIWFLGCTRIGMFQKHIIFHIFDIIAAPLLSNALFSSVLIKPLLLT